MIPLSDLKLSEIKQTISEILENRRNEDFRKNDFASNEASICFHFAEKYGWFDDIEQMENWIELPKIYHALFKDAEAKFFPNA